jgi:hypothetical protein
MPLLSSHNHFACLEVDTNRTSYMYYKQYRSRANPPIPNQCSRLPAWEYQLPIKYVVAASPGLMSLVVDMEIESTDTVVK